LLIFNESITNGNIAVDENSHLNGRMNVYDQKFYARHRRIFTDIGFDFHGVVTMSQEVSEDVEAQGG
jgi:hypothetical protein